MPTNKIEFFFCPKMQYTWTRVYCMYHRYKDPFFADFSTRQHLRICQSRVSGWGWDERNNIGLFCTANSVRHSLSYKQGFQPGQKTRDSQTAFVVVSHTVHVYFAPVSFAHITIQTHPPAALRAPQQNILQQLVVIGHVSQGPNSTAQHSALSPERSKAHVRWYEAAAR